MRNRFCVTGVLALCFLSQAGLAQSAPPIVRATDGMHPAPAVGAGPSRYIYMWAGTGTMSKKGTDMVVVYDANPASPKYGSVLNVLTVDTAGGMPHHSEFSAPEKGSLFVNDFHTDRSFLIDFRDPEHPILEAQLAPVPKARSTHSFARLPDNGVVATVQFGDGTVTGNPGGLAQFDAHGKLVRFSSSADPAFPDARIRTYALTTLPKIDRIVTTSSPMADERTADVVQVWRMSDLKLLKTLPVPVSQADSVHMYPFEVRTLADGRTVMLNTYYCGFYRINGLEKDPHIERVMAMEHPRNIGCSVPIIDGKYMVMPIAYAHRYATIDISDPAKPREVSSVQMDSTFYPHWIARDPGSDRVVVTDQGDGPPMLMVGHLDAVTGKLTWDERFRDAGATRAGVSLTNVNWPNGVTGTVTPHGSVFVR